uniref:Centromere protein n=1 Tax=Solanum tuberosum TaxID=4113 RepID=M1BBM4_SOLTU
MDTVHEALDEAKLEIEKLRVNYQGKAELCENLKRVNNELLTKNQEANLKVEKLSHELSGKEDELAVTKQLHEAIESKLREKETAVRHLSSTNDKLRADIAEMVRKFEEENRGLALALDGANSTNMDQEQQIRSLEQEIEGLRASALQKKKSLEVDEKRAKASKELRNTNDMLLEMEQENRKLTDQLKWRNEQFIHLEEAHGKLRQQLKKCEEEKEGLALSLDGANSTNVDQEQQIRSLKKEIEGLREFVLASQKKSSEAEKRAKASKELRHSDDMLFEIEEENRKLEEQLKWKKEQFSYLEEAHGKLKQQLSKYEEDGRGMALALDGANATNLDQEQQIRSLKQEIEGLRELVSSSQKKSSEVEKRTKTSKELRHNDDMLLDMEEEIKKLADQLKWKKESFSHLEEAHGRLRQQHLEEEKEWAKERSTLLDEISKLQVNLDSQLRISKDLESRLWMCNQALAHEESKRKLLEVQLAESKTTFNSVCAEYEESKSIIESLTSQRDKEIATLRDILGSRDTLHKEMEYQFRRVEQENHELMTSLKELQEAKIQEAGASSSLSKLRNKLKGLEQVHKDCFGNLKAKEAEWASKLEKLTGELDLYKSSVQSKDTLIIELREELETCESLTLQLTLQNEETSMMLLVLKSQFFELHQRIVDDYASMELEKREGVENISTLIKQLNTKNEALVRVQEDLEEEREKVALLSEKIESLNSEEQQQLPLQREVDTLKEMLKEASTSQSHLKEQVLHTKSDLEQVRDALDRANEELAESFEEGNELEFELQVWKSVAEKLKANLEENLQMRRQIEASLLAQADVEFDLKQERESLELELAEKDTRVNELQQQLFDQKREQTALLSENIEDKKTSQDLQKEVEYLEQEWVRKELEGAIFEHVEAETQHKKEKESLHQLVEEKDHRINDLQKDVEYLEQEWVRKELEETKHKKEKESLHQIVEEKDHRIYDLQKEVEYLEQEWVRKELEGAIFEHVEAETQHKKEKESLHQLVEEKDHRINDLQKDVEYLEQEWVRKELEGAIFEHVEAETQNKKEKESLHQLVEEKDHRINDLQKEVEYLEQEWVRKELEGAIFAKVEAETKHKKEKESLRQIVEEKDHRIYDLQRLVNSLENEFESSTSSFSASLSEMQAEVDVFHKTWEKMRTAEILKEIEIQMRNLVIVELENEFCKLQKEVEHLEKHASNSVGKRTELEDEIEAKISEIDVLQFKLEKQVRSSDIVIKNLRKEKAKLLEDVMKLSSDKDKLLDTFMELSERISRMSKEDMQLAGSLERMVQNCDSSMPGTDLKWDNEFFDPVKENNSRRPSTPTSTSTKRLEAILDERSPLRSLNN